MMDEFEKTVEAVIWDFKDRASFGLDI